MPTPLCRTLTSRATHVKNSWRIGSSLTPPVSSTTWWTTRDAKWQAFSEGVEESVRSFEVQEMNLRHRIRRLNRTMISAAAKHVGKSKPRSKTKPCSTPALRDAIKQRYTLRRTVQSNRMEYLAACGRVRRVSEETRRSKWEEILVDL